MPDLLRLITPLLPPATRRRLWHARLPDSPLKAFLAVPPPQPRSDWRQARYLALDLETTGSNPAQDDILSFGWVCLEGETIHLATAQHRLVRPRRALTAASVTVHRITDDRAAQGEPLEAVLRDLLAALAGRVLIAHYAQTETGFVDAACRACYGGPCITPVIDTLTLARRSAPAHAPGSLRLGALRARHHLPRYPLHHALSDALAAAELFLAQAESLSQDGALCLGRLLVR